jgi:hypothetical protein
MKQMPKRDTAKDRGAKAPGQVPAGRQTLLPLPGTLKSEAAKMGARKNLRQRNREAIERESYQLSAKSAGSTRPKQGERASPKKWEKIHRRAEELATTQGKRPGEVEERHLRRAKRELLGLQTLPDPENPLVRRKS